MDMSNFDLSICVHDVYRVSTCRPGWRHIIVAAGIQHVLKVVSTVMQSKYNQNN